MAVRTRENLIEVAKQVFMQKGLENTTIADIANASDRGRRTIYTYFKNKLEIYTAVIERESDRMVSELREIADSSDQPSEKLRKFLICRLSPTMNTTSPHSVLRSLFRLDFGLSEKARKKASEKEKSILTDIINECVDQNKISPQKANLLKSVLYTMIRSLDLMSANQDVPQPGSDFPTAFADLIDTTLNDRN